MLLSTSEPQTTLRLKSDSKPERRHHRAKDRPQAGQNPAPLPVPERLTIVLIETTVPLRWRDLDAYNHVNNSVFLTFLEEARIQWFDSLGSPWRSASSEPLLAATTINFRRPILYPETLRIRLSAERVGRSSLTIAQHISAAGAPDTLYADGNAVLVWVSPVDGRPVPLPEVVRRVAETRA
jgi:acyl-CoA thioester hydrolase